MRVKGFFCIQSLLAVAFIALSLLLAPSAARADSVRLQACVAPVEPGDRIDRIIWQAPRFDCKPDQTGYRPGDYWVRMAVPDGASDTKKSSIFRAASTRDDGFELWAVHSDGYIAHYRPFVEPQVNPMRLGGTVVTPIKSYSKPIQMLVARVDNSQGIRGIMLQPTLASSESAIATEMAMAALFSGFLGLCIALLVYNVSLWFGMRQPFLLAYCAMLVSAMLYAFMTSGAIHYLVPSLSGADRIRITTPLLALTAATGMIFIRHFFQDASVPKWLERATYVQIVLMLASALAYALVAPYQGKLLDEIYTLAFLPLPLIFLCYLWTGWKHRDPFLGYFLLAWSGPALSVIARIGFSLDILPYHLLIENSTLLGLAFEALVSSLAIGHRVRLIAQARDRAEIAEAHALEIADSDPLTGLLNRRAFLRMLLERKSNWTLLLLDIDHFKRVNDSVGHEGGDEAIIRFGETLKRSVPNGALVARMGGEEFAIAYRGDMLLIDPDNLLAQIRRIDLQGGYRITASMGIATRLVESDDDWKILYRAADMALYRAKSDGRDRFVLTRPQAVAA
jgi:diguanylate cyclase (GGDEF)-like protein